MTKIQIYNDIFTIHHWVSRYIKEKSLIIFHVLLFKTSSATVWNIHFLLKQKVYTGSPARISFGHYTLNTTFNIHEHWLSLTSNMLLHSITMSKVGQSFWAGSGGYRFPPKHPIFEGNVQHRVFDNNSTMLPFRCPFQDCSWTVSFFFPQKRLVMR